MSLEKGAAHTSASSTYASSQQARRNAEDELVYACGSVRGIPNQYEARRDRFLELDSLQEGWKVEMRRKQGGSTIDAVFYSPSGGSSLACKESSIVWQQIVVEAKRDPATVCR